jgi:prepilin-type N-terminal cleavage/methylation domain-containing protein
LPFRTSARGFSLIETLVATTIVAVGVTALAQLFVLAIGANARAKQTTRATVFAQHKMEELRAEPALTPSPPDTLDRNTHGYHDTSAGEVPLIRRWSVEPLPAAPDGTFVLQVRVLAAGRSGARGEVQLTSVVRRAP